jgi:hypothetical protein
VPCATTALRARRDRASCLNELSDREAGVKPPPSDYLGRRAVAFSDGSGDARDLRADLADARTQGREAVKTPLVFLLGMRIPITVPRAVPQAGDCRIRGT